jgi:hypothetical protein
MDSISGDITAWSRRKRKSLQRALPRRMGTSWGHTFLCASAPRQRACTPGPSQVKPLVLGLEPLQLTPHVIELIETKQFGRLLHGEPDLRWRRLRNGNGESTVR